MPLPLLRYPYYGYPVLIITADRDLFRPGYYPCVMATGVADTTMGILPCGYYHGGPIPTTNAVRHRTSQPPRQAVALVTLLRARLQRKIRFGLSSKPDFKFSSKNQREKLPQYSAWAPWLTATLFAGLLVIATGARFAQRAFTIQFFLRRRNALSTDSPFLIVLRST